MCSHFLLVLALLIRKDLRDGDNNGIKVVF